MDRNLIRESDDASSELSERERLLAAREADLRARRREAARQLRRSRRVSSNVDARLTTIESLLAELAQAVLVKSDPTAVAASHAKTESNDADPEASAYGSRLDDETLAELESLRSEIDELTSHNEQLANELARASVHRSISKSSDANATMTWELRKALIFALYYVSEGGATQELRYEHMPGAWEPSIPVTADTRGYAVDISFGG